MNNPKYGATRRCQVCGARFYDLKRTKVVCPHCHAPFKLDAQPKAKRAIATPAKAELPAPVKETVEKRNARGMSDEDQAIKEFDVDIPADSLDSDGDDDEEPAFEDASELGEDEDDMAEVIDGSRKVDEA